MLKQILKLEGAQKLDKNEQKEVNGGKKLCPPCARIGALGCNYFLCET